MIFGEFAFGAAPFGADPEWLDTIPSTHMEGVGSMAARMYDLRVATLEDMTRTAVHAVSLKAYTLPAGPEVTLYFADHEFITAADDTPANTSFQGELRQPIEFTRSMLRSSGFGGLVRGSGTIVLNNTNGAYDAFEDSYAIDGRSVEVRVGRKGDAHEDMLPIFTGTVFDFYTDRDEFRIMVKDRTSSLDIPLIGSTFAGSGGIEGGSDLLLKRKPFLLGDCIFFSPVLVDAQRLIYMLNWPPFFAGVGLEVHVNGVPLLFAAFYNDLAAFQAASVAAGAFSFAIIATASSSALLIKLGSVPDNQLVTAKVSLNRGAGDFEDRPYTSKAAAVSDLALMFAPDLFWLVDFDRAAFYSHDTAQPSPIGLYFDHNDKSSIADAIERVCGEATFVGFNGAGEMTIGVVSSAIAAPVVSLDETSIDEIDKERLPDGLSPPPWRWKLGYQRVWTDMKGNIAGSVTTANRASLSEEIRIGGAFNTGLLDAHPQAQDRDSSDDMYAASSSAVTEAQRLLSLYSGSRRLYRIVTGHIGLLARFGQPVRITHHRFGLSAGKQGIVISDRYDAASGRVELLVFA